MERILTRGRYEPPKADGIKKKAEMLDGEDAVCYNKGKYRGAERLCAFNAPFRDNA